MAHHSTACGCDSGAPVRDSLPMTPRRDTHLLTAFDEDPSHASVHGVAQCNWSLPSLGTLTASVALLGRLPAGSHSQPQLRDNESLTEHPRKATSRQRCGAVA